MLMQQTLERLHELRLTGMAQALNEQRRMSDLETLSFEDRSVCETDEGGRGVDTGAVPTRLAEGDFELALRGLLGEGAPLSKASIRRLRAVWSSEFEMWAKRSLADREVVYVWADGIYVKAGLERDKAALLVVMGAIARRDERGSGRHIRLPGVNGLVGGGLSGSQGSRPRSAEATDGRR